MGIWEWCILGAHVLVSACLFIYAIHMYVLVILFFRGRHRRPTLPAEQVPDQPFVTIQIPLYNERFVARRAIQAACALEYPKDRLEVQILDDSTDDTTGIVDDEVKIQQAKGTNVAVVRRPERTDFKAGALQIGLEKCRGELIAVFDADFVPPTDWLMRIVPDLIQDPKAGWVQTRWGHLNDGESLLTRAQAIGIDGHFVVEQAARVGAGLFANFNGTAGLWRKSTIQDAGGWRGDTLTEDLDLSYRAQLRGWRMVYRPDVEVPGELPAQASALKSQQFRWAKGSIQTAMKLMTAVWASELGFLVKIAATIHLTSYAIHLLMLFSVLLAFPMLYFVERPVPSEFLILGSIMFAVGTLAPILLYASCQLTLYPNGLRKLVALPVLMALGMGVSVSNGQAVIEALVGRKSPFIRTPKRGDQKRSGYATPWNPVAMIEIALGIGTCYTASLYASHMIFSVALLLAVYACGFVSVGLLSWKDYPAVSRPEAEAAKCI